MQTDRQTLNRKKQSPGYVYILFYIKKQHLEVKNTNLKTPFTPQETR